MSATTPSSEPDAMAKAMENMSEEQKAKVNLSCGRVDAPCAHDLVVRQRLKLARSPSIDFLGFRCYSPVSSPTSSPLTKMSATIRPSSTLWWVPLSWHRAHHLLPTWCLLKLSRRRILFVPIFSLCLSQAGTIDPRELPEWDVDVAPPSFEGLNKEEVRD